MKINQKVKYGMACLLELSKTPTEFLDTEHIASRQTIPTAYAHKVLQSMARMGLVLGVKGAGYRIQRPLAEITALQLFRAFSREDETNDDSPIGRLLERRVDQALGSFTLQELARIQ